MHDPNVYPEPDEFRPERFIGADGKLDLSIPDPANAVFGFGRRYVAGCWLSHVVRSLPND